MSIHTKLVTALICLCFAGMLPAGAQKDDKKGAKEAAITKMVHDKKYVFHVQTSLPMAGRSRQETPGYTLKVYPDKIIADMPYYGRSYSADYGSSNGGIHFTSVKFEYTEEARKKGGWNISIKTKDTKDPTQLSLTIQPNGSATLQVTSNNRQPINFNGYADEK